MPFNSSSHTFDPPAIWAETVKSVGGVYVQGSRSVPVRASLCSLTMAQVAMRSVMFVERLELEFAGSQFSHALTLGDVDSDGV